MKENAEEYWKNNKRKSGNDFNVPEDYFDTLPNKMQNSILDTSDSYKRTITLLLKPQLVIALMIVIIGVVSWISLYKENRKQSNAVVLIENKVDSIAANDYKTKDSGALTQTRYAITKESVVAIDTSQFVPMEEDVTKIALNSSQDLDMLLDEGIDEDLIIEALLRD